MLDKFNTKQSPFTGYTGFGGGVAYYSVTDESGYELSKSLRFDGASTKLSRTVSVAGNRKAWTFSTWIKRGGGLSTDDAIASVPGGGANGWYCRFRSDNKLEIGDYDGVFNYRYYTNQTFDDFGAWYHLVFKFDSANATAELRGQTFINGEEITSWNTEQNPTLNLDGYVNSTFGFDLGVSPNNVEYSHSYLADTILVDGSSLDPTSFGEYNSDNVWVPKRYTGGYGTNGFRLNYTNTTSATTLAEDASPNGNDFTPAGVNVVDFSNTVKTFIASGLTTWPNLGNAFDGNTTTFSNATGNNGTVSSLDFNTPLTGVERLEVFWGGTSSYGYNQNTIGTGGSAAWIDFYNSPGNPITVNRIFGVSQAGAGVINVYGIRVNGTILTGYSEGNPSENDSMSDNPSNAEEAGTNAKGNFCTWNPQFRAFATVNFDNGNLDTEIQYTNGADTPYAVGTMLLESGKWYFETYIRRQSNDTTYIGFINGQKSGTTWAFGDIAAYFSDARVANQGSPGGYGQSYGSGDLIGCALDVDNGRIEFFKNGISQGVASSGLTHESWMPFISTNGTTQALLASTNFGQYPFRGPVPTDYQALSSANLPTTLADSGTGMNVVTWDGDNAADRDITGVGFAPDLVWIKQKSNSNGNHVLMDTVRGATRNLVSNDNQAEGSESNYLKSFANDGFRIGNSGLVNDGSSSYVAWNWKAGDATNPVGDAWRDGATKYIGIKFANSNGGTATFTQTTGSTTVDVWSGSDNTNWTQIGGVRTLSDGFTITTSDQYLYVRNTVNTTFTDWVAAASNNADGHYSASNHPSGAVWSGPAYTDFDFRQIGGGNLNTDGSIPSIIRANNDTGLSIVTYKGTGSADSIGHGLDEAPEFMIFKNRADAEEWFVYHHKLPSPQTQGLYLNGTADPQNFGSASLQGSNPTNSIITLGTSNLTNGGDDDMVAYVFKSVKGFSKFGLYKSCDPADPYVNCGFRPRFVMIKYITASSGSGSWAMYDTERTTINYNQNPLWANLSNREGFRGNGVNTGPMGQVEIGIYSNGFMLRGGGIEINEQNNQSYVYAAFAEDPYKTTRAK